MEYFAFNEELCMINEKFEKLFGVNTRKNGERIANKVIDIAKSIQFLWHSQGCFRS
ncbi:hypothetical protein NUACC26_012840 [Scytonema sp. NUACC26]